MNSTLSDALNVRVQSIIKNPSPAVRCIRAGTILALALAQPLRAEIPTPGLPEGSGLTPVTPTFYINTPDTINNGNTESLGVAIASNGNIIIGWEDDGDGLTDLAAVWALFDANGNLITPETPISSADGQTGTSRFLSYFRTDRSAVPPNTSWGPKIKANLFGDGFGMGATSYALGLEVPELAGINTQSDGEPGDFPSVQLVTNDGQPTAIVTGLSDADADVPGDVRIADWEFLSNGNIVIVGESRQETDLQDKFGGPGPGRHAVFRIVDPTGQEVKALSLVSETTDPNEIWHGVGVVSNGFGVRFSQANRTTIRLFDNSGNPTSGNIDLGTLTEHEIAASGGRGDGTGFHGNGVDAYVVASTGADEEGFRRVWVTVLNADGTVRYSRAASDDLESINPGRVDAAITPSGEVLVVWNDSNATQGAFSLVQGRRLDPTGEPVGPTFYVSERENADTATLESRNPRVAWRNGRVAIVWESQNSGETENRVVAGRLFSVGTNGAEEPHLTITRAGNEVSIDWGGTGALETATDVTGPWTAVTGAANPYTTQVTEARAYFRVRR